MILDFTAVWCGPCQQVSPLVSKMERDGVPIKRVDVDKYPDLKEKYGIRTIPTFVLLIDGKEVSRSSRYRSRLASPAEPAEPNCKAQTPS